MANDLLQRPDEDQDRTNQTQGVDELESLYEREAISDDQRNVDTSAPAADKLEEAYNQPARRNEDRNTSQPSVENDSEDSGKSLMNNLPSPMSRLKAIPGIVKGVRNKKRAGLIGGGLAAFIVTVMIGIFSLLPLKLHSIIENIESRAMAGVTQVVGNRVEGLVQHYIFKELMPTVARCGANRNQVVRLSQCPRGPLRTEQGFARELFETWRNSDFQQQFLQEFDVEYDPNKQRRGEAPYRLLTRTGEYDLFGNEFREMRQLSRTDFSREVRTFIKSNTKWYEILKRSGLRRVAKSYGFRRFAVGDELNELRDSADSRYRQAKYRVKLTYARRVLAPLSENYSKVFICMINGCSADSPELNDLRSGGDDRSERLARIVEDSIDPDLPGGTDRLLSRIIIKDVIESIFEKTAPRLAGKIGINAIPVAGTVISVVLIAEGLDDTQDWIQDGGLQKAQRNISTLAYVNHYSDAKSFVDESKAGEIRADDLGAKVAEYDNFDAESRTWQELFAQESGNNAVYAAEQKLCSDGEPLPRGELVCDFQKLSSSTDAVAVIENIVDVSQNISDFDTCGLPGVSQAEDIQQQAIDDFNEDSDGFTIDYTAEDLNPLRLLCDNLVGGVIDGFNSFLGWITGFFLDLTNLDEKIVELVQTWLGGPFGRLVELVKNQLFYSPIPEAPTGGENADAILAGNVSIAQNYLKGGVDENGEIFGLGMPRISEEEYVKLSEEAVDAEREVFASMSFVERLATAGVDRSKQLAFNVLRGGNSKPQIIKNNLASMINTTLTTPGSVIQRSVVPSSAYAADSGLNALTAFDHYFYGVSSDNGYYSSDPEQYTEEECQEIDQAWIDSFNSETGDYELFNKCAAERDITRMIGTYYTNDDDSSLSQVIVNDQGVSVAGSQVVGDPYESSVSVNCAENTNDLGVHDAYVDGQKVQMRLCGIPNISSTSCESSPGCGYYIEGANRDVIVNSRVSGALYAMIEAAKADGVNLSASSSFRTMAHQESLFNGDTSLVATPGYSSHQAGVAVDFNNMGVKGGTTCPTRARSSSAEYQWLVNNAGDYGYKQYAREAWHWDMLDAANRCLGSEGFSGNNFQ